MNENGNFFFSKILITMFRLEIAMEIDSQSASETLDLLVGYKNNLNEDSKLFIKLFFH